MQKKQIQIKLSYFLITLFVFLSSVQLIAQEDSIYIPEIELTTISQVNIGNSYITFPTDIGNIESLWFEANLTPSFYIRKSKNARLMGVLTAQIIIRMFQEESYPVRTPSYMPQVTVYYKLRSKTNACSLSAFAKLAHHSNGQDGDFYLETGDINLKTGNFSTNYTEFGLIKTNFNKKRNAAQFFSSSFEFHFPGLTIDELDGQYSLYRWHNIFSIFKLPENKNKKREKASISLKGELTWLFGNMYDWNALDANRINLKFTFFYHPKFLEDIGFFTQFYHGQDYYNIYFDHQITILRFGIMTEKLKF